MNAKQIKANAVSSLIGIIKARVDALGGKVELTKPVYNGTARAHNDVWDLCLTAVFDFAHSNGNALERSETGLYYSQSGCYDAPIEELEFETLYKVALQCE